MSDGADHVIAVDVYTMCSLEKPSADTDLCALFLYINMLLQIRSENISIGVPELLQRFPFHSRNVEVEEHFLPQLTFFGGSGGSILFARSMTGTDRKIVHRLAEQLGLKSQSQGYGSNRRLSINVIGWINQLRLSVRACDVARKCPGIQDLRSRGFCP